MALDSNTVKAKAGAKAAKTALKNPGLIGTGAKVSKPLARLAVGVAKPVVKRRVRRRSEMFAETAQMVGDTARTIGELLATYGVPAAYELGLIEPPKPKRTIPRVAAGVVIGASAVYFLEPECGPEHRKKVAQLMS